MRPAVFVDRDGTLVEEVGEEHRTRIKREYFGIP